MGGIYGIPFVSSGLSKILRNENGEFELVPNGTVPIAAFLPSPTNRMPNVNATSVTFAEMTETEGNFTSPFLVFTKDHEFNLIKQLFFQQDNDYNVFFIR